MRTVGVRFVHSACGFDRVAVDRGEWGRHCKNVDQSAIAFDQVFERDEVKFVKERLERAADRDAKATGFDQWAGVGGFRETFGKGNVRLENAEHFTDVDFCCVTGQSNPTSASACCVYEPVDVERMNDLRQVVGRGITRIRNDRGWRDLVQMCAAIHQNAYRKVCAGGEAQRKLPLSTDLS